MSRVRYCENCGSPLEPGTRFCENCGAPVSTENSQERGESRRTPSRETPGRSTQAPPRETSGRSTQTPPRETSGRSTQAPPRGTPGRSTQAPPRKTPKRNAQEPYRDNFQGAGQYRQPQTPPSYQQEDERRRRYRQEGLENDWQQSWDREPLEEDEKGITPVQYVLIGLAVVLLIALIVFGVFWVMGRSSKKSAGDRNSGQTASLQTDRRESESDAIAILDGGETRKTEATEKQTETSPQTEAADIVLNYPEFSVTLPGSWKGKYGITQGADYYTFYQQASKAMGTGGALFTISRYKDTSYKELPNYEVLGTGNNAAFIFQKPTDVQFATDDAAVTQEYQSMAQEVDTIKSGIKILVSGAGPAETEPIQIQTQAQTQPQTQAQTSSGEGYIPESSQRALTESDVSGMSYDDLQMAINEIYARHGRKFNDPNIQAYFNSQSWYQGIIAPEDFSDSVFSATESQNIQYLLKKMGVQ